MSGVGYIRRSKLVPNMAEHIAAHVRRLRKAKRLTQAQLAQLAGVSRDTVHQIEKGESEHGYSTIESVMLALGAKMEDIDHVTRPPIPEPPPRPLSDNQKRAIELFAVLSETHQEVVLTLAQLLRTGEVQEAAARSAIALQGTAPHKR